MVNFCSDNASGAAPEVLRALEAKARFDASRRLIPWLCAILLHRIQEVQRQSEREEVLEALRIDRATDSDDPAAWAAWSEAQGHLEAAISALRAPYREVVRMHLEERSPPRAIAACLGRAPSTVRTQLARGLDLLRGTLPPGFRS